MKHLYELTLNQSEKILNKVQEHCKEDIYVNESYVSKEAGNSFVQDIFYFILAYLNCQSAGEATASELEGSVYLNLYKYKDKGIRPIIAVLKHFRRCINDACLSINEDKDLLFKRLNENNKFFDMMELSIINRLNDIEKVDAMLQQELLRQATESKKLLNEAIEQDKLKTEFFSNLSHELRTPLNVILGTLQLMDMHTTSNIDTTSEKTRRYHKIMRQNCYRLLRLVNNLIDLNKLDAGFMKLDMENHDVVGIISKIASSVSDYIENLGINFLYYTKVDTKVIACDPDKIERIILNLLSNAIKFTNRGGKIQVTVWDENEKLYISVKDSGIGIAKDKQDLVFNRFVQIERSLSRNHQGSGIGLSLVKSLVELHQGKISLISDSGQGCEFVIELPVNELKIMESVGKQMDYSGNNRIEVINIEFSDIYS